MASKLKKHDLNIYLAKSDVTKLSDIIKDPDSLAQWEIPVTGFTTVAGFMRSSNAKRMSVPTETSAAPFAGWSVAVVVSTVTETVGGPGTGSRIPEATTVH